MTSKTWRLGRGVIPLMVLSSLAVGLSLAACHRGEDRPSRPSARVRGEQYVIEEEELKGATGQTLYDVIRNLRPVWLTRTVRGASGNNAVVVYLDQRVIGAMNILREMDPRVARRLQYLSPTEAQLRFGPTHGSRAAIVVDLAK